MPAFSRHTTSAVLAGTSTCAGGGMGEKRYQSVAPKTGTACKQWQNSRPGHWSPCRLLARAIPYPGRPLTQSLAADVTGSEATMHTREPRSE